MHPFSTGSFARFIRSPEPPPEAPSAHRPRDSSSTARRLGQGRRSRRAKRGNPLRSRAPCYPGDGDGQTAPLAMMALRVLVELSHPESVSFHPQILRKSLFYFLLARATTQNEPRSGEPPRPAPPPILHFEFLVFYFLLARPPNPKRAAKRRATQPRATTHFAF